MLSREGVHSLVALDVVLHRDPRIGVPEQLGGKERVLRIVDDGRDSASESMRCDVLDPSVIHHVTQESADVVRCVRRPGSSTEQERIRIGFAASEKT